MATKPSTKSSAVAEGPISIHPSTFVATGLADNFTAVIKKARFIPWHYPNRPDLEAQCSLNLVLETDEANGAPPLLEQPYSAAKLSFFVPSPDGKRRANLNSENKEDWEGAFLVKAEGSTVTAIARQSNYATFINAAIEAGLDPNAIPEDGDCRFLEGYKMRFSRLEVKGRSGATDKPANSKSDGKVLLPVEVLGKEAAGKKSKATAAEAPAKASKKKAVAEEAEEEDDDAGEQIGAVLEAAIVEALAEKSPLGPKGLAKVIFRTGASGPDQKAMTALIGDVEWMGDDERPWMYNEETGFVSAVSAEDEEEE